MTHLDDAARYLKGSVDSYCERVKSGVGASELEAYAEVLRTALDNFRSVASDTVEGGDPLVRGGGDQREPLDGAIPHRVDEVLAARYDVRVDNRPRLLKIARKLAQEPDACVQTEINTAADALVALLSDAQAEVARKLGDAGAQVSSDVVILGEVERVSQPRNQI
ncbi:hypothetical protein ALI144C_01815 [Actinosynnema sp. ALI-1.44]|uniref:hypothetical protein n=1 Tax=Actinosynnema sp. ALI-1.44 TaxID=1933779 RepID=UPI00097BDFD0|nr:hypothetical protein [Actinosynnema sp. ALI-1.44]ONI90989.1 hypothetical protein ALI144C_01815 [Actinosynnema sp. ALI-1.44]